MPLFPASGSEPGLRGCVVGPWWSGMPAGYPPIIGKHSCPGRIFAANELKPILAHAVMNYDFEIQESRPKNKWYGKVRVSPAKAKAKIRKRITT